MKTKLSLTNIYRKVKNSLGSNPKNKYYPNGRPCELSHSGLSARFFSDGRVESYKTRHEFIRFGYSANGDSYVKEYKSTPSFSWGEKCIALYKKFL